MKVLIAGDFCENGRVTKFIEEENYEHLFCDIKEIVSKADVSIVNCEFPIVSSTGNPIKKVGRNLKGSINSVKALKYAGFKVCALANNHILDQGNDCCKETRELLEKFNIQTVGVGQNLSEAQKPLYVNVNGRILAIINCCENEFSIATESSYGCNPINPVSQYYSIQEAKKCSDYIVVVAHGGVEGYQLPTPRMKELYRFFIDVGADAVLNGHQHCFSGYEYYNGGLIFYGLGNFLFDWEGKRNCLWNEGYFVELDLDSNKKKFNIYPYIQCDEDASIHLYNGGGKKQEFINRIEALNKTISNDNELKENLSYFSCVSSKSEFINLFSPYNNKYLNALMNKRLLPSSVWNEEKWLRLLNGIQCESHRERLLHYLKDYIKYI